MQPEAGPLQLYNWAEYVNPAVLKSFEKKYGVEVQLSTFSTLDEAVAKLTAGAVGYDVFVPTQPEISLLVAGKVIQPLNLDYIPNLKRNVWKALQSPWYDVGSRYTVPYTVFSTGIAWRNDFLPDYDPSKFANPYDSFWQMERDLGQGGDARRPARRPRLRPPPQRHHRRQHRQSGPGRRVQEGDPGTDRQGQPALLHQRLPAHRRRLDLVAPGLGRRHDRDRLLPAEGNPGHRGQLLVAAGRPRADGQRHDGGAERRRRTRSSPTSSSTTCWTSKRRS